MLATLPQSSTFQPLRTGGDKVSGLSRADWWVVAGLLAVNAFIYAQLASAGFIVYDDHGYVIGNPHVLAGLSWEGSCWAFSTFERSNWHPLSWLSLMLDQQLFGAWAGGFHLTNAALHAANATLFFLWLRMGSGSAVWRPAALGALLWTVHPLHVESVAWVTERKDVLSTLFLLGTLLAYSRYARGEGRRFYGLALLSTALGLLAKPMLVTVPPLLLLLDWWPLRRLDGPTGWKDGRWRGLLWEKLPFVTLALAASVVTSQAQGGAKVSLVAFPLPWRLVHAVCAYGEYLGRTLWPAGLALPYPFKPAVPWVGFAASLAALVFITLATLRAGRARPYLPVGWLWFLGTLVPVIGLVQVGSQSLADRYTYVPHLGLSALAGFALCDPALRRWGTRAGWPVALGVVAAAALAFASRAQAALWHDSVRLFTHTLEVCGPSHLNHRLLGSSYLDAGDLPGALSSYEAASRAAPENLADLTVVGDLRLRLGDYAGAVGPLARIAAREPGNANVWNGLGRALAGAGRGGEAAAVFRQCLEKWPDDESARRTLSNLSAGEAK